MLSYRLEPTYLNINDIAFGRLFRRCASAVLRMSIIGKSFFKGFEEMMK